MSGFTLDARQTALLADITAACSVAGEDALPWEVLVQVQRLLHADAIEFGGFDTLLPHVWFQQNIEPTGEMWYNGETPTEALDNPFLGHLLGPMLQLSRSIRRLRVRDTPE
ncbi:MAG: hypothetical protein WKF73_00470 [Nocardioidaceae bacterium]